MTKKHLSELLQQYMYLVSQFPAKSGILEVKSLPAGCISSKFCSSQNVQTQNLRTISNLSTLALDLCLHCIRATGNTRGGYFCKFQKGVSREGS